MSNKDWNDTLICLTPLEYYFLLRAEEFLSILEAHGVDNWNGYEIAQGEASENDLEGTVVRWVKEKQRDQEKRHVDA